MEQLNKLATRGFNISIDSHKRDGQTLEAKVGACRGAGHIGFKQGNEIFEAETIVIVTAFVDDGLYYQGIAATAEDAVDRVLKQSNSVLAIW